MILLDTNVLSALMQHKPDVAVVRWLDRQPRTSVWTTAISVFEIRFGLQSMPAGKRRLLMLGAFDRVLAEMIQQRIAPFDNTAAQQAADLLAERQSGRCGDLRGTMIAGITLASHVQSSAGNRNCPSNFLSQP